MEFLSSALVFYESVKMTLWFNCHTSSQNTSAAICILTIGCLNNGYTYLGELEYEKPTGDIVLGYILKQPRGHRVHAANSFILFRLQPIERFSRQA